MHITTRIALCLAGVALFSIGYAVAGDSLVPIIAIPAAAIGAAGALSVMVALAHY
jgi:hypothetical protein